MLAPLCHHAETKVLALNGTEATLSSDSPVGQCPPVGTSTHRARTTGTCNSCYEGCIGSSCQTSTRLCNVPCARPAGCRASSWARVSRTTITSSASASPSAKTCFCTVPGLRMAHTEGGKPSPQKLPCFWGAFTQTSQHVHLPCRPEGPCYRGEVQRCNRIGTGSRICRNSY